MMRLVSDRRTQLVRAWLWAALCAGACSAGCGGAAPEEPSSYRATSSGGEAWQPPPPEPEGSVDDYAQRIEALQGELAQRLTDDQAGVATNQQAPVFEQLDADSAAESEAPRRPPPTRCEVAADLRDRICDLAGRICDLAEQHADDAELRDRCDASRTACAQATSDVAEQCG